MRALGRTGEIRAMEFASPVRVTIDVDVQEPPQGRLTDEHGDVKVFEGWLGLMDGLQDAIARASLQRARAQEGL
jgi:hypothetical protein